MMRKRYVIAQSNFVHTEPCAGPVAMLPIFIGDHLCVTAASEGWCYGYNVDCPSMCGLFPESAATEARPSTSIYSDGAILAAEISRVLQLWWTRIKELYSRNTELHWIDEVLTTLDDLLRIRKKLLSDGVPSEELAHLQITTAATIDRINMLLSLNIIIRRPNGIPYRLDDLSLIQLYDEHKRTEAKMAADPNDRSSRDESNLFSILFEVNSVTMNQKFDCEFMYQIYDLTSASFVSEPFRFLWKTDGKRLRDPVVKALFCDLKSVDPNEGLQRLVLVGRIAKVAPIEPTGSTPKKQSEPGPPSLYCRQLIAFDIMDLAPVIDENSEGTEKIVFFNKDDSFAETLRNAAVLNKLTNIKNPNIIRPDDEFKAMISLQRLSGPWTSLRTRFPHIFARAPPAPVFRTDFSMASSGSEARNEIYLTIMGAEISGKFSDKNIECRLSVLNRNAELIENRFECSEPSGLSQNSSYHSYVILHEDKPKWIEPVKIRLPENTNADLHLKFLFFARRPFDKNKPEKGPLCIAFLKLLEEAVLAKDGEHELLVYKVEMQNYDDSNISYLSLPENRKVLKDVGATARIPQTPAFSLMEKSTFTVRTQACSNIFTHNSHLLNIFRWRMVPTKTLEASLSAVANRTGDVSSNFESEVMKNMVTLLDTLFDALGERESLELLLFDSLVAVLRMCDGQRHAECAPLLADYISRFPYTNAAPKIIRGINHYLSSADTSNSTLTKTMNTLKVLGTLAQLISESKMSADRLGEPIPQFCEMLDALLDSFVRLMSEVGDRMNVQNTALRHLPAAIPYLVRVFDDGRLTKHLCRVIASFRENIVSQMRLKFVGQIVDCDLFLEPNWRAELFPKCLEQLLIHLCAEEFTCRELAKGAIESGRILATMLDRLWPQQGVVWGSEEEFILIVDHCYRPLVRVLVLITLSHQEADADLVEGRGLLFTAILSIFNRMSAQTFSHLLASHYLLQDKIDLLFEMLQMLRDCLTSSPFPHTWTSMIMAQNKVVNKTLHFAMRAITDKMFNEIYDLGREYILTAVAFITHVGSRNEHDWLRDENDEASNLRRPAAKDLRSLWFRLAHARKMQYVPNLVGSFLRVALIPDEQIREAIIPIFFDMMLCEFHNLVSVKNFDQFYNEFISQLDALVMRDHGTRSFQHQFTQLMRQQCQSDPELWQNGGRDFIAKAHRLLGHLFEYRAVKESSDCIETDMSRIVQLMRFYEQYGHYDLQITYVYKLYELHIQYGNDIEAAMTLLIHAGKLSWGENDLPEFLVRHSLNRHCHNERQLKEQLLLSVTGLFSKGDMWENSIDILRQLQEIYYSVDYNYDKMADLLELQASLFRKIDKENRAYFYFYLVGFYGKGFPNFLNGKRFVFRSDQLERHGDFLQRMKQMYGAHEEYATMDDCSYLETSPGRHLQLFKVDPVCHAVALGPNVNPAIKEYYRHYNIAKFEYCRTHTVKSSKWTEVQNNDLMRTWVTRRVAATAETLPSLLRFSQVVSVSPPVEVSPLALAVQSMRAKNEKLSEAAILVKRNPMYSVRNFSGDIQGVVHAAVMGGVKNYEVFFEERCAQIYTEEEHALCTDLKNLIIEQVGIVENCIYVHQQRTDADSGIHSMLVEGFHQHKDYVKRLFQIEIASTLPTGSSIMDSVAEPQPNPTLSEREKKLSSMSIGQVSIDEPSPGFITTGSNTLKKGLQKVFTSAPRKSFGSSVALLSTSVMKQAEKQSDMFDRVMRNDSVENFKRFVHKASPLTSPLKKHTSSPSLDTVRLRTNKSPAPTASTAPPLPLRADIDTVPVPFERSLKNKVLPGRKDKPPPPTPDV